MMSALTAIAIAICGTSLICFVLMRRPERRRAGGRTGSDGGVSDGGTLTSENSGVWSWFGSGHSSGDHSGASGDWGGGDSGGGDSGGGDGGGGGD